MNMKKALILIIFIFVCIGGVFSQEGYIKPTFSFGNISVAFNDEGYSLTAVGVDIDYINSFGLTFGLQGFMVWNSDMAETFVPVGIGYTYTANSFSVGGKVMVLSFENQGAIGGDVNGAFFINSSIGFSGGVSYYQSIGDLNDYSFFFLRLGVSARI